MKNSWLIWIFIVAVVITVFIAFNYESGKKTAPLSEIFSEETQPVDVEYEFADQNTVATPTVNQQTAQVATVTPATTTKKAAVKEIAAQPQPTVATAPVASVTQAPAATTTDVPAGSYTIQVASYGKKDMAENLANQLKAKNFASFVGSRTLDSKTYYRVYVGQFNSKDQAQTTLAEVQKQYKGSFIISPKK